MDGNGTEREGDGSSDPIKDARALLGVKKGDSLKTVKKAFGKKVLSIHPDRSNLESAHKMTIRVIAAFRLLELDFEAKDKATAAGNSAESALPQIAKLPDKEMSEEYKKKFDRFQEEARNVKFENNFFEFYEEVFDKVIAYPGLKVEPFFNCSTCSRDYLSKGDHHNLVYGELLQHFEDIEFSKSLEEYLLEIVEDLKDWEPIPWDVHTSLWTNDDIWQTQFQNLCEQMEAFKKDCDLREEPFSDVNEIKSSLDASIGKIVGEEGVLLFLILFDFDQPNRPQVLQDVLSSTFDFSGGFKISSLVYPAYLKVWESCQLWTQQIENYIHEGLFSAALVFGKIQQGLDKELSTNNFIEYGWSTLKYHPAETNVAHLLFQLGSCDLHYMGMELIRKGHVDLGVQYLLRGKHTQTVLDMGNRVRIEKGCLSAVPYLMPLIFTAIKEESLDSIILVLEKMLPTKKLWNCILSIVKLSPESLLCSQYLCQVVLEQFLGELKSLSVGKKEEGKELEKEMDRRKWLISTGIPSVLHILSDMTSSTEEKEHYPSSSLIQAGHFLGHAEVREAADNYWKTTFPEELDYLFKSFSSGRLDSTIVKAILNPHSVPGVLFILKNYSISEEEMLCPKSILQRLPFHSAMLFVLIGTIHYHRKNFTSMILFYEQSRLHQVGFSITNALAALVSDPVLHECTLNAAWDEFRTLKFEVEAESVIQLSRFPLLLSELEPRCNLRWKDRLFKDDIYEIEADMVDEDEESICKAERSGDWYRDQGYAYLDLTALTQSTPHHIGVLIQATSNFYNAMKLAETYESKYAYGSLIGTIGRDLLSLNSSILSPPLALYVRKTSLTFMFATELYMSKELKDSTKDESKIEKTPKKLIQQELVSSASTQWLLYLQEKALWMETGTEVYDICDTTFYSGSAHTLLKEVLILKSEQTNEKRKKLLPPCVFQTHLLNGVYRGYIKLESDSEEEQETEENSHKQEDGPQAEKDSKDKISSAEPQAEEISNDSTDQTFHKGFYELRNKAMSGLVAHKGFYMDDIRHMMNWPLLRRTEDGFLDSKDLSLQFPPGEKTYCKFQKLIINESGVQFDLLPSVEGDPSRPPLFTAKDVEEIIGMRIDHAWLSFDEANDLEPDLLLRLPHNPFFKVTFGPKTVCGTEVLMTLFHLDNILKILTTGQEVSSKSMRFRRVEDGLLANASEKLKEILCPVSHLKKVRKLSPLEHVQRFFFVANSVEFEWAEASKEPIEWRFGDVTNFGLETAKLVRNQETMEHEDDPEQDKSSPEFQYVQRFNENLPEIEQTIPLISRLRELVKIFAAAKVLLTVDKLCKDVAQEPLCVKSPGGRNSSCEGTCVGEQAKCNWSYWVPAVYRESKVTMKQKLDHILEIMMYGKNKGSPVGQGGLRGAQRQPLSMGEQQVGEEAIPEPLGNPGDDGNEQSGTESKLPTEDDAKNDSRYLNWANIQEYLVYGGIIADGSVIAKPLSEMIPGDQVRYKNLTPHEQQHVDCNPYSYRVKNGIVTKIGSDVYYERYSNLGELSYNYDPESEEIRKLRHATGKKLTKDTFKAAMWAGSSLAPTALSKAVGTVTIGITMGVVGSCYDYDALMRQKGVVTDKERDRIFFTNMGGSVGSMAGGLLGQAACGAVPGVGPFLVPVCKVGGSIGGGLLGSKAAVNSMAEKCVIGAALDISKIIPNIKTDEDIFHEVVIWSPQRIIDKIKEKADILQPNETFRDEYRFAVNLNRDDNSHDILTKTFWCIRMIVKFRTPENIHTVEIYLHRDLATPSGEETFKGLVHVEAELLEQSILLPCTWITPFTYGWSLSVQTDPLDRVMAFKESVGLGWNLTFPTYEYDNSRGELLTMEVRMLIKMNYLLPPPIIPLPSVLTDVLTSTSTIAQNFLPEADSDGLQNEKELLEKAIAQLTEGLKLLNAGETGEMKDGDEVSDTLGASGGSGEEEKASTSQQSGLSLPAASHVPFTGLLEDAVFEDSDFVDDFFPKAEADKICPSCNQSFENVRKHIKDVHEKPHKCTYAGCSYGGGTRCDVDRHIRKVHLKERRFPCPSCGKMCTDPSDVKRHLGGVHGICGVPDCSWTDPDQPRQPGRKRRWEEHTKETHK